MGRIAPRRRKNNRVYQPLLHTWLTIRQKIMPDPKATDEQNLMPEISAPEHTASAEDVITTEDSVSANGNVPPESVASATAEKGIKGLLLKIWHLPDSFEWMEPLPLFHRRWVIVATAVLLLALLWPASRDNTNLSFPVSAPSTSVPLQAQLQGNLDAPPPPTVALPNHLLWRREIGKVIKFNQGKRWHSYSVIIICRSMKFLRWHRLKVTISH